MGAVAAANRISGCKPADFGDLDLILNGASDE
jgi:hypothetical protein